MKAFLYGTALQWRLDLRSKSLLITCYVVPLLFYALMGGIFTSINPESKATLIQSMTVMCVSMGALIGLPPSLVEHYGSDVKKMYSANGVPLYLGILSMSLSAFLHLLIMCGVITLTAPFVFDASLPRNLPLYFGSLAVFLAVSLSAGCALGLCVKSQAKLTMISQLLFLPSIMLSGILFPISLLPRFLASAGKIFPAAWGYRLMTEEGVYWQNLLPLAVLLSAAVLLCTLLLKRLQKE